MWRALVLATLLERAAGHAHMVLPMSRNEMAYQLQNNPPPGMPSAFRHCPHCCVGGNSCGGGDTRGTDVWQQWYDASGLAMPELTPGSDFKVSQLMNADHGGQVWLGVACGNEISESVNWTFLERSEFDRGANYLPSNPEIFGWYENMSYTSYREWYLHVPAWFACPGGTAVGRWLWKTGNSCNDFNNVGFNTKPFKQSEWAAVGKNVGACSGSPETFISCIDFRVTGSSSPTPAPVPTPPQPTQAPTTQAPTQAPTTQAPTPAPAGPGLCCYGGCGGGNCQGGWCGESQGNCEGNCGGEFCPAAAALASPQARLGSSRARKLMAKHE